MPLVSESYPSAPALEPLLQAARKNGGDTHQPCTLVSVCLLKRALFIEAEAKSLGTLADFFRLRTICRPQLIYCK